MHSAMHPAGMHPDLEPLAFLVGTWLGHGRGEYPTIRSFVYGEEVRFWHIGRPFLCYSQRTWNLENGRPMHSEVGFWRPQPEGGLEVVLSHPTGVAELYEGTVRGASIELETSQVALTSSAKEVDKLKRSILLTGDLMTYEVRMAAVGQPLEHHLAAELRRQSGADEPSAGFR